MVTQLKSWREQDYYEILEISPKAAEEEIRIAYEKLHTIYTPNSPGITVLFTPEEVKEIHDKIEEAYRILRDPRSQRDYDLVLRGEGEMPAAPTPSAPVTNRILSPKEISEALGDAEITWSGEQLRNIRQYLSLEFDEVAAQTKVGKHNLKAIEEEDTEALPAPVYLKGFLRTYAKALGLDPHRVTEDYIEGIKGKGYLKD
jgi:flagellar biosynthesis protein FlhG